MLLKGETIKLIATFTDDSGVAATPTTPVTVTVKKPDGTLDVNGQTVSEGATGIFTFSYTTSVIGPHSYMYESADGARESGTFYVHTAVE